MQLQKVPNSQPWNISGTKLINITTLFSFCEGFYGHLVEILGLPQTRMMQPDEKNKQNQTTILRVQVRMKQCGRL